MARVYTRTGDAGETSLYSGERVAKCCDRVECYGSIDELQAALGMARALCADERVCDTVRTVERMLVNVMAELATVDGDPRILPEDVSAIEAQIDAYEAFLPKGFTWRVPGDRRDSAALHVARTVARRCERALLRCMKTEGVAVGDELRVYLNRVSDLCYVCACYLDEAVCGDPA